MAITREIVRLLVEGADKAKRDLKGVSSALGGVNTALKVAAAGATAAGAAFAAFNVALEQAAEGAKLRDLENAARRLGTTAADVNRLRAAVAGTVTDADLLRFNNMAQALGLNQQQFQKATQVAKSAAGVLGIDVRFAMESVTVGLARQSKLWLDNLGIVLDTEGAYKRYAASIGTTAAQLDDAQKKQAFFNEFVRAGNKLIASAPTDRAADQFERLSAELDNVGDAASKLFSVAFGRALMALDDFSGATERARLRSNETARALRDSGDAARAAWTEYEKLARFYTQGHSAQRVAAQRIEALQSRFAEAATQFASAAKASAKNAAQPFVNAADAVAGAWERAFDRVTGAIRGSLTPDALPAFIQRFGVGVADPAEAARQRALAARRGRGRRGEQFDRGRALQDTAREQAARELAAQAEAQRKAEALEQQRLRLVAQGVEARIEARRRERAAEAAAAESERESRFASISMLDANAAAWARLASSAKSASQIIAGVAAPAIGQITQAFGQAAVSALFAGEAFNVALGNALVFAGQQLMAQAISFLALAGIFAFVPWLQPLAGPLATASAAGLGVGLALVGSGVALGGDVKAQIPGVTGGASGGSGRVTGGDIESERTIRRGSGAPLRGGSSRQSTFNVFLGGESLDRGINRAAVRGSRYDSTRRALPA